MKGLIALLEGDTTESHLYLSQFWQSEKTTLEAAGDLVGCVEGPEDLSTNPKHMQGFGE